LATPKRSRSPKKSSSIPKRKIPSTAPAKTPKTIGRVKAAPTPMRAADEPTNNRTEQGTGRRRIGTVGPTNSASGRRRNRANRRY
jgi:hypothetical protein